MEQAGTEKKKKSGNLQTFFSLHMRKATQTKIKNKMECLAAIR